MSECKGLLGKIFGHKYYANYSFGSPMLIDVKRVTEEGFIRMIEATKPATYEGSICERCGHKITKDKE
jgi:hypothetical protein